VTEVEVGEGEERGFRGSGGVWTVDGASFKSKVYNNAWKEKKPENTAGSAMYVSMYVCRYVLLMY
jgi:hypothetical protein